MQKVIDQDKYNQLQTYISGRKANRTFFIFHKPVKS